MVIGPSCMPHQVINVVGVSCNVEVDVSEAWQTSSGRFTFQRNSRRVWVRSTKGHIAASVPNALFFNIAIFDGLGKLGVHPPVNISLVKRWRVFYCSYLVLIICTFISRFSFARLRGFNQWSKGVSEKGVRGTFVDVILASHTFVVFLV